MNKTLKNKLTIVIIFACSISITTSTFAREVVHCFAPFNGYEVIWKDLQNTTYSCQTGDIYANVGGWNSGGISRNSLDTWEGGTVDYTVGTSLSYKMFGLSSWNTTAGYGSINYAIYVHPSTTLYVFENGQNVGSYGTIQQNDKLTVEKTASSIIYKKNGVAFRTVAVTFTQELFVDVSIYYSGDSFSNLRTSFSSQYETVWEEVKDVLYDPSIETIAALNTGWNSGAISGNELQSNECGFVSYKIESLSGAKMLGLSKWNDNPSYASIDYAVYYANNSILVYEGGAYKGSFGSVQIGDEIIVERYGPTIYYKKNGVTFRSVTTDFSLSLHADVVLYQSGVSMSNISCSFSNKLKATATLSHLPCKSNDLGAIDLSVTGGCSPYTYLWSNGATSEDIGSLNVGSYSVTVTDANSINKYYSFNIGYELIWNQLQDINYNTNLKSISAISTTWSSGALSDNILEGNKSGSVVYRVDNTVGDKMMGLSNWNSNPSYSSIDYAIYYANANVVVYESGSNVGTYGTFRTNDEFSISRNGSNIEYKKNGVVFRSVATNPADILYVDASIYNSGLSFANVSTSYSCPSPGYPLLTKKLDASFFITLHQHLWFQYEEEYSLDIGVNDNLNATIYKPDMSEVTSVPSKIITKTGANYYEMDLSSLPDFNVGEYYVLEITNNKNEKFLLRFLYQ